jgi:hypothetical protein
MRRRGQVALAFGRNDAFRSLWYLPVDAVAMLLTMALAKVYGASAASQTVRLFGDAWLAVVARAEADFATDALFAVVDFIGSGGRSAHMACGAHAATPEAIAAAVAKSPAAQGYVAERINAVNVSHIIRMVRTAAARHGIDLTDRFLPAPGTAEFAELMAPYKQQEIGIVEVGARRKREASARRIGEQVRARATGQGAGSRRARSRSPQAA